MSVSPSTRKPKGFFLQIMQIIHIQTRLIRMLYIPKCGESYSIRPLDPNVEIGQVIQHQSRVHFCRAVLSAYNYEFVFSVCSVYEYDWNAQPAVMRVCRPPPPPLPDPPPPVHLAAEAAPVAKSEGCQPNHFGLELWLGLELGYGLGKM